MSRRRLQPRNPMLIAAGALFCGFILSGFLMAPAILSQPEDGRSVEGRVLTPSNAIVTGAVVQIKDTKSLQIRSFITQEDGRYRFYGLNPSSDYEITAEKNGSTSGIRTLSMFDNRKKVVMDIKMKKDPDSK